jgi:hypothetical protein
MSQRLMNANYSEAVVVVDLRTVGPRPLALGFGIEEGLTVICSRLPSGCHGPSTHKSNFYLSSFLAPGCTLARDSMQLNLRLSATTRASSECVSASLRSFQLVVVSTIRTL